MFCLGHRRTPVSLLSATFSLSFSRAIFHSALFFEGLSNSEQLAELGSVHLLAFSAGACSLSFVSLGVPFLVICWALFNFFFSFLFVCLFSGLFLGLSLFSDSVDFSCFKGSVFLFFSGLFRGSSSTVLFFFLVLFFLALRNAALSSENACY